MHEIDTQKEWKNTKNSEKTLKTDKNASHKIDDIENVSGRVFWEVKYVFLPLFMFLGYGSNSRSKLKMVKSPIFVKNT